MRVDEIKAGSTQRSTEILEAAHAVSISAREEKQKGKKRRGRKYTERYIHLAQPYWHVRMVATDINPAAQKNASQSVLSKAVKSGDLVDI